MEAKDTVQLRKLFDQFCLEANIDQSKEKLDYLFNWYTESSFKAGRESILEETKAGNISVNDLIQGAKEAGIKEVVDWIEKQGTDEANGKLYVFVGADWQAKLKEWGID